jgi:hypothetical protein
MKRCCGFVWCGLVVACGGAGAPDHASGFQLDPRQGACPAGYAISSSDYTSTNVSAISSQGAVLAESVISSGSAPPGLTTALSGDVIFPSSAPGSGKLVLIDRYPNSVLTWVEPATGSVSRQLPVGTGFAANPHDYLELGPNKAYVSRYESNAMSGRESFDAGGDLLIIDPEAAAISGRVDLSLEDDGDFLPRADHLLLVEPQVWVSLHRFDADFRGAGDARLVGVDTTSDTRAWTVDLPGVASCGGMARSPSGKVVALACSGVTSDLDPEHNPAPTLRSGIVLLDASVEPPVVRAQFDAAAQLAAPIGSSIAFASETLLVGVALGDLTVDRSDVAFTIDTSVGTAEVLHDAGGAFSLGDLRCAPGCSDLCFLADAQDSALRVWKATGNALTAQPSITVDTSIGLPPRAIGPL